MDKKIIDRILTSSLINIHTLDPDTRKDLENIIGNTVGVCIEAIDDGDGSMSSRAENSWLGVCRRDIAKTFDIPLDKNYHLVK